MKSILIVDTPSSCKSCKYYDEWWCKIEDHCPEDDMGENGRAIWCPLRPLPEWKEVSEYLETNRDWEAWGFDQCLTEILGDAEGEAE